MGLSRLSAACRACPYVSTCNHKRMEAFGYLPMPEPTVTIQAEQSVQIDNALEQMSRLFQIPKQYLRGDSL